MRIACVATHDFEDVELTEPLEALRGAGHEVTIIGRSGGEEIRGKKGKAKVRCDLGIDEADPEQFDALFIPGGHSPDQLRGDQRFVDFTRVFGRRHKPIFAICHGAQLLLTANLLDGRTVTAWKTVQDDLRRAGIDVKDEEVVVDRELVTSRQPSDIPAFIRAMLGALEHLQAGEAAESEQPTLH